MPQRPQGRQNWLVGTCFDVVFDFSPNWAHQAFPMLAAILITLASVVLGTALALMPSVRRAWMGPLRTFALTAAVTVVVMHLLPMALAQIGGWAVLVFCFGLVTPEALGKLGETLWRARQPAPSGPQSAELRRVMALEAAYFGLLLHRVGDGVGLGAFTGEIYSSAASAGVMTAMSAHAVPVVAIMVLAFDSVQGRGSALARALGLWIASTAGVWFSHSLPQAAFAEASAYISAFVGGTLLHVVTHDLTADLPKTPAQRGLDLIAMALGGYLTMIGHETHGHGAGSEDVTVHMLDVVLELAVQAMPGLVIGLSVVAVWAQLAAPPPVAQRLVLHGTGSFLERTRHTFGELLHHVTAWIVLGIVACGLLEVAVPAFGTALAAVVLGPMSIFAALPLLRRWYGATGQFVLQLSAVGAVWALGAACWRFFGPGGNAGTEDHGHLASQSSAWLVLASISGLIVLQAVYRAGVRGLLSTLVGQHGHSHGESAPGVYTFAAHGPGQPSSPLMSHGHAHGGQPCNHAHGDGSEH